MNTIELDTKFFIGGNATFTVDNGAGVHYTFKIRQPRGENKPYFVSLLSGPNNESDYTYLGVFCAVTGDVRLTRASKMNDNSTPIKVVRWALKHVYGDRLLPDGYAIHHEGKCGCCGRTLTVPESIKRGIGPECWSRIMGA
jgi:hypothetical protein